MRGVTDLRRYLNKSDNPYIVSVLDFERLGDPVSEPHADEAEEEWFDVPEENPILPDWLTPTQAPKIKSPVTAAPTSLNIFRHHPMCPTICRFRFKTSRMAGTFRTKFLMKSRSTGLHRRQQVRPSYSSMRRLQIPLQEPSSSSKL
ncbi:hypothetical protein DPMN_036122 [Dreissena polymorpha]|uniref:Uncharacterized protein n=1 Tax=Dreissena polymorpha TaxID=45954 RepID=A0A9D4MAV7_DREPO|nr:hypothetical protein DPMN_036122 [Dreissena polymorpha]